MEWTTNMSTQIFTIKQLFAVVGPGPVCRPFPPLRSIRTIALVRGWPWSSVSWRTKCARSCAWGSSQRCWGVLVGHGVVLAVLAVLMGEHLELNRQDDDGFFVEAEKLPRSHPTASIHPGTSQPPRFRSGSFFVSRPDMGHFDAALGYESPRLDLVTTTASSLDCNQRLGRCWKTDKLEIKHNKGNKTFPGKGGFPKRRTRGKYRDSSREKEDLKVLLGGISLGLHPRQEAQSK